MLFRSEGDDSAAMDQAAERLTKASHKLAEVMYRQQQPGGGDAGPAPGGPGGGATGAGRQGSGASDEVIDAEYVEK